MGKKTGRNFKGRTKKEVILWWICLLIVFLASVVIASMGYIFYLGNHMAVVHTSQTYAVMEIRIEITTAHLWFEEIINGDRDESIDTVWEHLDEANWYAQAMLEGGENPYWKYYPVDDARVQQEVENIQAKLAEFRAITEERFSALAGSPAGSEIDRRYDAVFAEIMNCADQVESKIKQMINRDLRNFHIVQTVLIFICVVLTVFVGIVIGRFMHRQIRDELKLRAANQQLDSSNQQLRASEQQLRAANQQLLSSEQQLKAANQQLNASNQQLRAIEDQLRKLIHNMGERIKELNCLYELSRLVGPSDITLEEIFQGLAELIPPGWHYPEITCARVVFEDREFKTANFKQTKWKQSANIKVSGREAGVVEVYYLKECPMLDEGPFLKEERNLIDGISRTMSEAIERKKAEEALRASNQQLIANEQQLKAANQQLIASEQQLRASNLQLLSSEQQLKASNQQLMSSEQQLKAANLQLIASQEEIQSLANFPSENSNPVLRVTKDGIVLYSNEAGVPLLTTWDTQMGRRLPDKWCKFAADVFGSGSSQEIECNYDDYVLSLTFAPVVDLGYVNVYGLDITKRKKAADAIQKQREEFQIIFDSVPAGIWYKDTENRFLRVNKAAAESISMKPEDIEGKKTCEIFPQDAEHYYKDDLEVIKSGKPKWGIIEEMQVPGGEKKCVRTDKVPYRDEQGNVSRVIVFVMDITEQKRAEQHLKTSLEEKEVLLREIHHRVKNNLQIIVSLLSLQSEYVQDKQAVELFRESQFRVKSMALLHERLYETEDLAHINFSDYIRDLTNELLCSYGTDTRNIKLKINVKDVFPSVDIAVPCALIINELVTNCLKYAFPGGRAGEIRIEFDSDKQDNCTLLISDDGVGFAKDVDFPGGRTLGLQLVSTLAEQLQGSVVLDKSAGTSFKISFSKPQ